ncbi:MAG: acetolactate synthase small subunit [Bacteroidota bacterium]
MSENKTTYTLSIFTENQVGLIQRITTVFTRRHINIDSLTTSETEVSGIYRFVIVIQSHEEQVRKLITQLEKIIGVIKAFKLKEEDVVHQELALYKVSTEKLKNGSVEKVIRDNHARILSIDEDHIMIEKTGHPTETLSLFHKLEEFGVLGFSRSGIIAISKKPLNVRSYLTQAGQEA